MTLTEEQTRLVKVNRETKELKLAELRGELVRKDVVQKTMEKIVGAFKSRVLALPKRLAPLLVARSQVVEIEALLEKEVHDALRELSVGGLLKGSGDESDSTTAQVDGERVGRSEKKVKPRGKRRAGAVEDGEG